MDRHRRLVAILACVAFICTPVLAGSKVSIAGPFSSWGDSFQQALDLFSRSHGVDVEVVNATSWADHRQKVPVMAAAGLCPDVLYGDGGTVLLFANQGVSQPIRPFAEKEIDMTIFPSRVLAVLEEKGQLYALPTALSPHNLYYNTEMFAQTGVAHLPVSWESPELSWNDYVAIVKKLTVDTDGDGQPNRFGTQGLGAHSIGTNMIGTWGLHLINKGGNQWYGDTPDVILALERISQLRTEFNAVGGSLTGGTAALAPLQASNLNTFANMPSFRWSVGPMPKGTQRSSQCGYHGLGIAMDTRQPVLAWKLVKHLTYDPEGTILFTRAENRVPVHPRAGRDFVQRWSKILTEPVAWCIANSIGYAYETQLPRATHYTEISAILTESGRRVYNGDASVKQVFTEIAPQIRALMQ